MIDLLMSLALPVAALGIVAFMVFAFWRDPRVFAAAAGLSVVAFCCVTLVLASKVWLYGREMPLVGGARYLLFAWVIMVAWFVSAWRYRVRLLGAILMPLALFALLVATFEDRQPGQAVNLPTVPMYMHLLLMFAYLALVGVAFAGAMIFLVKTRALKGHAATALDSDLPAVDTLKRLMEVPFSLGFPCLTIGLVLGILYAGTKFVNGWYWEPKTVWTLAIWLYYGALFLLRHSRGLSNRALARGILVLFLVTLSSFFFSTHRNIIDDALGRRAAALPPELRPDSRAVPMTALPSGIAPSSVTAPPISPEPAAVPTP